MRKLSETSTANLDNKEGHTDSTPDIIFLRLQKAFDVTLNFNYTVSIYIYIDGPYLHI